MKLDELLFRRRLLLSRPEARCFRCTEAVWSVLLAAAAGLALCPPARAARDPQPSAEIALTPLGYESPRPELLAAGSAMATVDYADANHLLVTFATRHLIPRDPDDPPGDDDRLVAAYLLEVPSGKVVAQTEWHLHDRGQYLWNVGHGRFLLRTRDHLAVLAPAAAAQPQDAFRQLPFLHFEKKIVAISVSPERDLLIVQTAQPRSKTVSLGDADPDATPAHSSVEINFYRVAPSGNSLLALSAGMLRSASVLSLPVTGQGYLDAAEVKHGHWQFQFSSIAGKISTLADFETACVPRVTFVSQSEFIAFGCRGSEDREDIAGFDMNGDFMWEQSFYDQHISPTFAFAPAAGRFAFGRTTISSSSTSGLSLTTSEVTGQEVRVYQTWSGKVLLQLPCTPAMRSGQNFALSPDGMHLALLREMNVQHKATKDYDAYTSHEAAVDIYDLPALSKDDQAALDGRHKFGPMPELPRLDLAIMSSNSERNAIAKRSEAEQGDQTKAFVPASAAADSQPVVDSQPSDAGSVSAAAPASSPTATAGQSEGDADPDQNRKAPTLYTPGEGSGAGGQSAPDAGTDVAHP